MKKFKRTLKQMTAAVMAAGLMSSGMLTAIHPETAFATEAESTENGESEAAETSSEAAGETGETAEGSETEAASDAQTTEGAEGEAAEGETSEDQASDETAEDLPDTAEEDADLPDNSDQENYSTPTEWPAMSEIETPAAIVMDADTGAVLYSKDAETQYYPASITKILTALVVLENAQLDDIVTFSEEAVYNNEGDTSHIARDVDEQMTVEQTLYGMMLESANECAWALAEHVGGGDVQVFVDMMNAKAEELGCQHSHFVNPNGLHDDNHYTCAADMALIAQAAWENENFRRIAGTRNYTIPPTNKHAEETILNNHHQMLNYYKTDDYLYDACVGGKTGFTPEARYTLVTYCEQNGQTLIAVVMNTEFPTEYVDTTALMNYGLGNFYTTTTEEDQDSFISAAAASMNKIDAKGVTVGDGVATLPNGLKLTDCDTDLEMYDRDDMERDDNGNYIIAKVNFSWQGNALGSVELVSTSRPSEAAAEAAEDETGGSNTKSTKLSPMQIILIVIGVILAILLIIYGIARYRREQRRKARQEALRQKRLEEQREREREEEEQRNRRRNTRYRTSERSRERAEEVYGKNSRRAGSSERANGRSGEGRRGEDGRDGRSTESEVTSRTAATEEERRRLRAQEHRRQREEERRRNPYDNNYPRR